MIKLRYSYIAALIVVLLSNHAAAQSGGWFNLDSLESGGYAAISVKYSMVNQQSAVFAGGYCGWLINHTILIGAGGYSLANKVTADATPMQMRGKIYYISAGYGGLVLEYIGGMWGVLQYNTSILAGGGGAKNALLNEVTLENTSAKAFFIAEFGLNAEVGLQKYVKLFAGGSYRMVSGLKLQGLSNTDLAGASLCIGFKFGSF